MIYEKHERKDLIGAANLAKALRLVQIRPQKVLFENNMPLAGATHDKSMRVQIDHKGESFKMREGHLDVTIPARVQFVDADDEDSGDISNRVILAKIKLKYLLTFTMPAEPMPKKVQEEALPAFIKSTALTIAWPYIRHHIDHLASASGIPFVMPILCIDAVEPPCPER